MHIDIEVIKPIIKKAREIALPYYGNVAHIEKSAQMNDVLTALDTEIETYLKSELAIHYPDIAFVGEETGGDRSATRKWLCDPIDGTALFVRGMPFCTTMLALIEDGQVTFSVIYDFVTDHFYHAIKGAGAFCDGAPIHVSDRSSGKAYLSWETHLTKPENLETHFQLMKHGSFFKTMTAGHEFILVATGKIEGRICFDPFGGDYDYAAGSLLVSEAGGVVANIGSSVYDYTNLNFIASNKEIFSALTQGPDAVFPIQS